MTDAFKKNMERLAHFLSQYQKHKLRIATEKENRILEEIKNIEIPGKKGILYAAAVSEALVRGDVKQAYAYLKEAKGTGTEKYGWINLALYLSNIETEQRRKEWKGIKLEQHALNAFSNIVRYDKHLGIYHLAGYYVKKAELEYNPDFLEMAIDLYMIVNSDLEKGTLKNKAAKKLEVLMRD